MSKIQNKAVKMGDEVKMEEGKKYFFPDVNGQAVTVKAKDKKEAEEKANKLTSK